MCTVNGLLEEDFENFWKRIGAVPVPKDMLNEWTDYVKQVVIPEIVQTIQDRTPTQEQIKKIFY